MKDVFGNINEYYLKEKCNILIDIDRIWPYDWTYIWHKKFEPIFTGLSVWSKKLYGLIFLFSSNNHTLFLHTILSWKYQINMKIIKLLSVTHQTLVLKILWKYIKKIHHRSQQYYSIIT